MTTTGTRETRIVADPTVPLVRIVREFDAPVAKVFRAHADPALFELWNGPRGTRMTTDRWDFRTGGAYRYVIASQGVDQGFVGSFHEIRLDSLIVQTFCWEGMRDSVALERLVFEDIGGGRTRLTGTSLVDSFESRDAFLQSGMETGVREGYERLDELLAQ